MAHVLVVQTYGDCDVARERNCLPCFLRFRALTVVQTELNLAAAGPEAAHSIFAAWGGTRSLVYCSNYHRLQISYQFICRMRNGSSTFRVTELFASSTSLRGQRYHSTWHGGETASS
jgi:hypothetical protein